MKVIAVLGALALVILGDRSSPLKAEAPTIPPTIVRITPPGLKRGSTVIVTVEGRSLAGTRAVLFDTPGLVGKVLEVRDLLEKEGPDNRKAGDTKEVVPQGRKGEARVEITAAGDTELGPHRFRIQTALGSSNLAVLDVGMLPEVREAEPNDSVVESQPINLPATITGTLGRTGDVDSFQFEAKVGQEVVCQVVAASLGSRLRSVLVLRDSTGKELARAGAFSDEPDARLLFKTPADGKYILSISDLGQRGGKEFFYRLNAGAYPYLLEVFPLGLHAGESAEVEVKGANLGDTHAVKVQAQAPPGAESWRRIPLRVKTSRGESLNSLWLAVGNEPEVLEREPNDSPDEAQPITVPVSINGHISGRTKHVPDEDYFRFRARQGQHFTIEVVAARLGSPLDSVVEILDGNGREIPRATVRCLLETILSYPDLDSREPAFSMVSIAGLRPYDDLMVGHELLQITFLPDQADVTAKVRSYGGERVPLLDTSPGAYLSRESQTDTPVYKVQILEPGKEAPPNGLPVYQLTWRNDDGGPGYGADSRLDFTAPRNGDYLLRLRDIRGLEGEEFAYCLTVREARPDFTLTARPNNPNVPVGGSVPVIVEADRRAGYNGPIEIQVRGLPRGVTARAATIPAGQDSTLVVLEASPQALTGESMSEPFEIVGRAQADGRELLRVADADQPLRLVSVIPPPDVLVAIEPQQVILQPKKETSITLHVERRNGFQGGVPCVIANLPPGVSVTDMGLNGVVVQENETSRTVTLRAEDWVKPIDQPIYVVGTVESSSSTQHVSAPAILKLGGRQEVARARKVGAPSGP